MFDKDFYPTPVETIEMMGIDCHDKIVLEPSAGSGNIIDWLKVNGVRDVLSCELNSNLAEIIKRKSRFIKDDFLKVRPEEISHIQMIIGNPPFSAGAKHVLHAWNIAPDGCEIVMLVNNETLENDHTRERRELLRVIEDYGQAINLGSTFEDAERSTGTEIGLIKLYKPQGESGEFEGFFMDEDQEEQGVGIMEYNAVRDVVQRYVFSCKKFEEILKLSDEMTVLNGPFGVGGIKVELGYNESVTTKDEYKKGLQKKAWKYLFDQMKLNKYVTSGVMKDINKFVENQSKVPFTMKNVYRMFEIIVGTREQTFNKSLVEAIDKFTEHTHENRYNIEGWKTNAGHLLNQKFIVGWCMEQGWGKSGKLTMRYGNYTDKINDLVKVLCSIEGENYDAIPDIYRYCQDNIIEANVWYQWGFFEFKGFKKGTMHLKFRSRDVWARLNQRYAKAKGEVLPEKI